MPNTGAPSTQRVIAQAKKLVFVPLIGSNGARNKIAAADTLNAAYINGKLNNVNPADRWYPMGPFTNVSDLREDPTYEDFDDGSRALVREGRRTFTGSLIGSYSRYLAKVNAIACQRAGFFAIDDCGNLVGRLGADGDLYPVEIQTQNLYGKLEKKTDTTSGKVMVTFDISMLEKDSDLRTVLASEVVGISLLDIEGLRDVTAVASNPATTSVDVSLSLLFDEPRASQAVAVTGWEDTDFAVYNLTTAAAVTVTGATEAPDGTYELTFTAQTSADVLRIRSAKNGFWFEITATVP